VRQVSPRQRYESCGQRNQSQLGSLVRADLEIVLGEEDLAEVEQPNVDVSAPNDPVGQLRRQRLLRLVVARHLLEHLGLPTPVLERLTRRLDEIARDRRAVEARELDARKDTMKDVVHLVEGRCHFIVAHERGAVGRWLREVGDHGRERVCAAVRFLRGSVAGEEWPDGGVQVLGIAREEVQVAVSDETVPDL